MRKHKHYWIQGALGTKRRRRGLKARGYTPKLHHRRHHVKSVRVVARNKGALHRYLDVPENEKIPVSMLHEAKRHIEHEYPMASGAHREMLVKHLRQINMALTLRKLPHRRHRR